MPASRRGRHVVGAPRAGCLEASTAGSFRRLPKNGSPSLLPAAIVTPWVCRRQPSFVAKWLQMWNFFEHGGVDGG